MTIDELKAEVERMEGQGVPGSAELYVGPYLATSLAAAANNRSVSIIFGGTK